MDFSDYTLVSFGDSFTFGVETVPMYDTSVKDLRPEQKQWKKDCNEKSYTQVLVDKMGFKDSLNFGVGGASNDRSMSLLESFLRSNPKKKVFVLFNFTSSSRFMLFPRLDENNEYINQIKTGKNNSTKITLYDCVDILPSHNDWMYDGRYPGINTKSVNQQYTYWRNSIQDVYNHVKDRRMLYYMLSSYNVPYVTFDGINDMDHRMLRDNPIQYINGDDFSMYADLCNENDEQYIFRHLDFLQSYYQELVNKSPLLCHHMGIEEQYKGSRNMTNYLNANYHVNTENGHWNTDGHIEVAKLIEKFINERYN